MNKTYNEILQFSEHDLDKIKKAGGKGSRLVQLFDGHYHIPPGFVILPTAFNETENTLQSHLWNDIKELLDDFRSQGFVYFAVRSSALAEDSVDASFAGEFETVLSLQTDDEIREAIQTVYDSRKSERVVAYSEAKGLDFHHEIAVIIQVMVDSDISGVLFTADPVTGDATYMIGNYTEGLGDKLVSGDVNAAEFKINYPKGKYEGPSELKKFSKHLFKLGKELESTYDSPQDIEWAIARGELYLLQTRPITNLSVGNWNEWKVNSTKMGNYTWSSTMTVDILPYPVKPSSWSVWETFLMRQDLDIPGSVDRPYGLIGGIVYVNVTFMYSVMRKVMNQKKANDYIIALFNKIPSSLNTIGIPFRPFFSQLMYPEIKGEFRKNKLLKVKEEIYEKITTDIQSLLISLPSTDSQDLYKVKDDLYVLFWEILTLQDYANEQFFMKNTKLRRSLEKYLDSDQIDELISHFSGLSEDLESMGVLVGVDRLLNGEITEKEFIGKYGHRSPYENYLSHPRPYEIPDWVDTQIKLYKEANLDIKERLKLTNVKFDKTWDRLKENIPSRTAEKIRTQIDEIHEITNMREQTRSQLTRVIGGFRALFVRSGELLEIGDDIFFLTLDEMLSAVNGDLSSLEYISIRRQNFESYQKLPHLPQWIQGSFDPVQWAQDLNRSYNLVKMRGEDEFDDDVDIAGSPGSAGVVEGVVRVVSSPEEGEQIKRGEIMVTTTTNVGWTPIFPRLAGVVTDFGATLSHAAIVARELGIPAVVGCGDATLKLKTGDRIKIDGTKGTVLIIKE